MGGGKRTRERALPKIFGALQKSFWSALSWIFVQEKQSTDTWGGWKTYRTRGGPKPLFGRGVIHEVFHPPLFSTPRWRPLMTGFAVLQLPTEFRQDRNCFGINHCIDSQNKICEELILTILALQTYFREDAPLSPLHATSLNPGFFLEDAPLSPLHATYSNPSGLTGIRSWHKPEIARSFSITITLHNFKLHSLEWCVRLFSVCLWTLTIDSYIP